MTIDINAIRSEKGGSPQTYLTSHSLRSIGIDAVEAVITADLLYRQKLAFVSEKRATRAELQKSLTDLFKIGGKAAVSNEDSSKLKKLGAELDNLD